MSVGFFIGRILVGAFYLYNALNHLLNFSMLTEYAKSKGVPLPGLAVAVAGVLLLVAGVTLLLGVVPELGVGALIVFFIPVTLIIHSFWADADPGQRANDLVNFTKNFALLGSALMFLKISKPWPFSLGAKKQQA
jgi:putative oxidoreductase